MERPIHSFGDFVAFAAPVRRSQAATSQKPGQKPLRVNTALVSPRNKPLPPLPMSFSPIVGDDIMESIPDVPRTDVPATSTDVPHSIYLQPIIYGSNSSQPPITKMFELNLDPKPAAPSLCGGSSPGSMLTTDKSRDVNPEGDEPTSDKISPRVHLTAMRGVRSSGINPSSPSPTFSRPLTEGSSMRLPSKIDFKLLPPPLRLHRQQELNRPVSQFSNTSDDEDVEKASSDKQVDAGALAPSRLTRRSPQQGTHITPELEKNQTSRKRRQLFSPKSISKRGRIGTLEFKSPSLHHRFADKYRRRAKMGAASSPVGSDMQVLPSCSRRGSGPSTPYPRKHSGSPISSIPPRSPARKAVIEFQRRASVLRTAVGKAGRRMISPSTRRVGRNKEVNPVQCEIMEE